MQQPTSETTSVQDQPSIANQPKTRTQRQSATSLCAALLAGTFFLPWETFLFFKPSGFDFQKLSDELKVFWLLPILSVITVIAGFIGKSQKIPGQLAGSAPVFILIYGIYKQGPDTFQALLPGAWAALILGSALFILARR